MALSSSFINRVFVVNKLARHFSNMGRNDLCCNDNRIVEQVRALLPDLGDVHHKGQHGRIGIIGGSEEYTGAPYFAGISALRVGADLVHVFCAKAAAQPIKSYSPDLIVHPVLDRPDAVAEISKWLDRLHLLVIGPGLSQDAVVMANVRALLATDAIKDKGLVIDADGLALVDYLSTIPGLRGILTPNAIEKQRMNGRIPDQFTVMYKGARDEIVRSGESHPGALFPGTGRRCGGQGDLLSGAIATLYHWAISAGVANPTVIACQGASLLIRLCNFEAVKIRGRGTVAADMIEQIPVVFKEYFEGT